MSIVVSCSDDNAGVRTTTSGNHISGIVKDSLGVVLPFAKVKLFKKLEESVWDDAKHSESDEQEAFEFADLGKGVYRVLSDFDDKLWATTDVIEFVDSVGEEISIAYWVVPKDTGTAGSVLVSDAHSGTTYTGFYSQVNTDLRIEFTYGPGGGGTKGGRSFYSNAVEANKLPHITILAFGPGSVHFFVNGVQNSVIIKSGTGDLEVKWGTGLVQVGNASGDLNGGYLMDGLVGDIRVWNREVLQNELDWFMEGVVTSQSSLITE